MSEVTTPAESSPAIEADPFNGQQPSLSEFSEYRLTGEVAERFKPEPAAEVEETENEPAAATGEDQELPEGIGNKARKRFEKLLAENKALKAAQQAKQDAIPAPSAAPQVAPVASTRPEPTLNDKNQDGTLKYADYAAFVKDLGRWSAEQGYHELRQREIQQQQTQQVQSKVERDRERYGEEFDKIIEPTAGKIMGDASIPVEVKRMMAASDVLPELVYTIGTDPKTMEKLIRIARTDPQQAMYYIAELSAGIRQELAAEHEEKPTPEPKRTSAPKPPVPVSGPSSRAFDVSDTSLSAEEWARKRTAQINRRRG